MLIMFATSAIAVFAQNAIDPNSPGTTPETAWTFGHSMNLTNIPTPGYGTSHWYVIHVDSIGPEYRVTLNALNGRATVIIRDENFQNVVQFSSNSAGNITLNPGKYYIEISPFEQNISQNATYSFLIRPVAQRSLVTGDNHGGPFYVTVINNRLRINNQWIEIPDFRDTGSRSITAIPGHWQPIHVSNLHFSVGEMLMSQQGQRVPYTNSPYFLEISIANVRVTRGPGAGNFYDYVHDPRFEISTSVPMWYYIRTNGDGEIWLEPFHDMHVLPRTSAEEWFRSPLGLQPFYPQIIHQNSVPLNIVAAPTLSVDAATQTLVGATDRMEFSIDGITWTRLTSGIGNIQSIFPGEDDPDVTIGVRYIGTDIHLASSSISILISARPDENIPCIIEDIRNELFDEYGNQIVPIFIAISNTPIEDKSDFIVQYFRNRFSIPLDIFMLAQPNLAGMSDQWTVTIGEGSAALTINVTVSASVFDVEFVSIWETGRNTRIWEISFIVNETFVDGEVESFNMSIQISNQNMNISGEYFFKYGPLKGHTLVFDIRNNGNVIAAFELR